MFVRPQLLIILIFVAIFGTSGCGGVSDAPKLYRVTGVVTYKGQNVPGAKVMFMGDGTKPPAVDITNDDGKYSLSSLAGPGAVAGRHIVAVVKESEAEPFEKINMSMEEAAVASQKPEKPAKPTSLIPAKYSSPQSSGLEFEVTSGTNEFAIELID